MELGLRFRGLIMKTVIFLSLAIAAVFGIRFAPPIFAPIIIIALLISVIILNRVINKRLVRTWGREILSVGTTYVIYEGGIYVRPVDAFYPWSELRSVTRDLQGITFSFIDGTEITLPSNVETALRNCGCIHNLGNY